MTMTKTIISRIVLTASIIYIVGTYFVFFLPRETVVDLGKEDHYFENATAIFFLVAALLFFLTYIKDPEGNDLLGFKTSRNMFYLIMAVAFFFAAGEEISWGQRLLHVKTPVLLEVINTQRETNIHNLIVFQHGKIKWFNLVFNAGVLFYCGLVPLINSYSRKVSAILRQINLPLIPMYLAVLFVMVVISLKILSLVTTGGIKTTADEMKESNLAFLFMAASIYFCFAKASNFAHRTVGHRSRELK
jgi:hypothetical protein